MLILKFKLCIVVLDLSFERNQFSKFQFWKKNMKIKRSADPAPDISESNNFEGDAYADEVNKATDNIGDTDHTVSHHAGGVLSQSLSSVNVSESPTSDPDKRRLAFLADLLAPLKFTETERLGALGMVAHGIESKPNTLRLLSAMLDLKLVKILRFEVRYPFYLIETKGGRQIHATARNLLSQSAFRQRVFERCGILIPDFKRDGWRRVVQILTDCSDLVESDPELTADGSLQLKIDEYFKEIGLSGHSKSDVLTPIMSQRPFMKDSYRHLFLVS